MLVDIGMPVYNGERWIREALDSLLSQTWREFRLFISDNASTDQTGAICLEYEKRDPRIQYIRQPKNVGAVANFTFLCEQATSRYFMWAACDDIWAPSYVEKCVRFLEANAERGFVVTKAKIESRFHPIFSRWFVPSLSFVSLPRREDRVLAYTSLPDGSHKDNLLYGLWRLDVLKRVMSDIRHLHILGGPMNEYALALYSGGFINETLFFKKYKYATPGHAFGLWLAKASRFKNKLLGIQAQPASNMAAMEKELQNLQKVLEIARMEPSLIERAVEMNRKNRGMPPKNAPC